jgi:predicted nuclease with TOPRIM domain
MTRKEFDKKYRKVQRTVVKILLIMMIILLLLQYFNNLKLVNALIKRSNEQTTQMHQLEQEVHQLQVANSRLEDNVAYEYKQIQQLNSKPAQVKYIRVEQKQETVQDTHVADPISPTTTIIGTLVTIGTMIKNISIFSLTSR